MCRSIAAGVAWVVTTTKMGIATGYFANANAVAFEKTSHPRRS
jgi:predicted anti-sigma-YlaC factor YlaD